MNSDHQDTIKGSINRFLFQDTESGFTILLLDINGGKSIAAKGKIPPLAVGQEVELGGQWIMDPKYGKQFEISMCRGYLPTTLTGLTNFLGSGLIKGIGKTYAEKLVKRFGEKVLEIIDKDIGRLSEISGIGPKRIETIANAWKDHKEIAEIMVFLQDKGISPNLATRIYKQYKTNTIPFLLQNPYRIAEEIWGIGFKTADEIAQKLGFSVDSNHRIRAGILYAMVVNNQQGHLFIEVNELKKSVNTLLSLQENNETALKVKHELHALYDQEKIKLVSTEDGHFLTTTKCYNAEHGAARKLTELLVHKSPFVFETNRIYRELSSNTSDNVCLNDNQIQGVMTALGQKVTIITGGPGTGKTTLVKKLLSILEHEKIRYKLAAPTGRAAKRITENSGRPAATIHRLLEFDPISMSFKHNESNALDLDFLVVDEASMIDIFLAYSLLKALPRRAHLILIGDIDQLPSVGAGNFLNDCIESGQIPCVRLTEVFRQAQDSLIIVNAHRTNKGEFPVTFLPGARRDFQFIKDPDPMHLPNHLKKILFSELAKHHIPIEDAVILTPMNRSNAGTQFLNQQLQIMLNPGEKQYITFAGTQFKVGDRVMQIRNNYDKFVFNGDIGTIKSVDTEEKTLVVGFNEREIDYDFTELNELVLAYAITIHKSQGSEYSAVIIPIYIQHFTLLQRNLIYTAITRAKKLCILVGETRALAMALKNNKNAQRITFLKKFLKDHEN